MSTGVSFTLEQDGQKSRGAMPPSEKWRATAPPSTDMRWCLFADVIRECRYISFARVSVRFTVAAPASKWGGGKYLFIYNIRRHSRRTQYWSNNKLKGGKGKG